MKLLPIFAALALAGCATVPAPADTPPSNVEVIADKVLVSGTQALIVANNGYQVIGGPVAALLETGAVPASLKAQIQAVDRVVAGALIKGAAAQDDATRAREAATALRGLADLSRLTGIKLPTF